MLVRRGELASGKCLWSAWLGLAHSILVPCEDWRWAVGWGNPSSKPALLRTELHSLLCMKQRMFAPILFPRERCVCKFFHSTRYIWNYSLAWLWDPLEQELVYTHRIRCHLAGKFLVKWMNNFFDKESFEDFSGPHRYYSLESKMIYELWLFHTQKQKCSG